MITKMYLEDCQCKYGLFIQVLNCNSMKQLRQYGRLQSQDSNSVIPGYKTADNKKKI